MERYTRGHIESMKSALPCSSIYVYTYCLVNQYKVILSFHTSTVRVEASLFNPIER